MDAVEWAFARLGDDQPAPGPRSTWAETLYAAKRSGHIYANKGNRDEFDGKAVLRAMRDTFYPDGRRRAVFTIPWWKAGRWIEIAVRTGTEPLVLQCLALLAGMLSPHMAKRAFAGLVEADDLARCTIYFSHYLFETYLRFGRADLFLEKLSLWRDLVRDGDSLSGTIAIPPNLPTTFIWRGNRIPLRAGNNNLH